MKGNKKISSILLFTFWLVFLLIYLYRLTEFPIFEDEAINLLMAERLFENPAGNFLTYMSHGFLPNLGWLIYLVRFVIRDSLFAGRFLNVFLASTLFLWIYLVKDMFKLPLRFFILSSALLLFSPILSLNSRLTLFDTPVMVFSIWALYFLILALKKSRTVFWIIFFSIFLLCLLTKFTSLFILPSLIYILYADYKEKKKWNETKFGIMFFSLVLIFFFLIVRPYFFSVSGDLTSGLVFNLNIHDILTRVHQNFWLFWNWSKVYYPYLPISILFFIILIFDGHKKRGKSLMIALLVWFAISLLIMIFFNRFYYPRHILILLMPLQLIPVYVLLRYPLRISIAIVCLIALLRILLFRDIIFDFTRAGMVKEDFFQYFEDYTSGINIKSVASYLSEKAVNNPNRKVVVWLDGSWVMEYGLRRTLKGIPNIEFKSFVDFESQRYPISGKVVKEINALNYVVINKNRPLNIDKMVLEKEFSWGGRHPEYIYVFKN